MTVPSPLIVQLIINDTQYQPRSWFSHPRVGEIVEAIDDETGKKRRYVVKEVVHRVPSNYALTSCRQEIDVFLEDEQ